MKGRQLFWIVVPLLGLALLLQMIEAVRDLRASRIVRRVELVSNQANQRGAMPRRLADLHFRMLREAAALRPDLVDVPVARGWQYLLLKRPQGAIRAFEEALALEPQSAVYANLGQAYWDAGRQEDAREAFAKAVVLEPRLRRQLRDRLAAPPP